LKSRERHVATLFLVLEAQIFDIRAPQRYMHSCTCHAACMRHQLKEAFTGNGAVKP
jgi:hypothetical protein